MPCRKLRSARPRTHTSDPTSLSVQLAANFVLPQTRLRGDRFTFEARQCRRAAGLHTAPGKDPSLLCAPTLCNLHLLSFRELGNDAQLALESSTTLLGLYLSALSAEAAMTVSQ